MAENRTISSNGLPILDDLSAPTIFVDSFAGVICSGGFFIFGCTQVVLEVKSETEMSPMKKLVLRLAIPSGSLVGMIQVLQGQLDALPQAKSNAE